MAELKYQITTVQRALATIVFLFLGTIFFLLSYKLYSGIRALSDDNYLKAVMFVCYWIVAYFVLYKGTIWKLQGEI